MSDDEDMGPPPPPPNNLGLDSDDDEGGAGGAGGAGGDAPSVAGSDVPPPANAQAGQSYSSSSLRQSHLWGRNPPVQRRGGSGGRGGGAASGGDGAASGGGASTGPRFERLSSLCLEVDLRQNADGGASSLFSEDAYQSDLIKKSKKSSKKKKRRDADEVSVMAPSEQDGEDGVEPADSEDDESAAARRRSKQAKRKMPESHQSEAAAALAAAAFGTSVPMMTASDSESDDESLFSADSEAKKRAHKKAFPIKGVHCIGCAMAHKIQPVEKFVLDNISRMSSDALWKHAALTWKLEIVDKAKREGNVVPDWAWKEIQSHFLLHCSNPVIARQSTITQLQLMRTTVENRLVRVEEDGSRELDKVGADLMLKIIKQESAERTLLANLMGGGSGASGAAGKGGKAAGGPTVGDAGAK